MSRFQCGLIGCGTVGAGVVRLWSAHVAGARIRAVAVRDVRKPRDVDLSGIQVTDDALALVRSPEIGLVIEATGDTGAGYALGVEALAQGKAFVTASKSLVARHGLELEERAAATGAAFRYEAAAGGALPIVALLRLGLSPGPIQGFTGVLNGTCNFVLSRLAEGIPLRAALEGARRAGFAEADPRRDTSGRDAAEKLVLLARLCGARMTAESVVTQGIESLDPGDSAFGLRRGWALRMLAVFESGDARAVASVGPAFVPQDSLLAQARDEENVVVLDGGVAGRIGLLGRGAGSLPSAAAVLADVREVLGGGSSPPPAPARAVIVDPHGDDRATRHYVRIKVPFGGRSARRELQRSLAEAGVGIDELSLDRLGGAQAVTATAPGSCVRRALAGLRAGETVHVPLREMREVAVHSGDRSGSGGIVEAG